MGKSSLINGLVGKKVLQSSVFTNTFMLQCFRKTLISGLLTDFIDAITTGSQRVTHTWSHKTLPDYLPDEYRATV